MAMVRILAVLAMLVGLSTGVRAGEIHEVAAQGDLAAVKALLESNPELISEADSSGYLPLHEAAYAGQDSVLAYLVAAGADLNAASHSGSVPLHGAAYFGHLEAVRLLVEAGADISLVNSGGYSPLLGAAAGGHLEIVKFLVERGGDLDKSRSDGSSALTLAAMSGNLPMAEYLLSKGIDTELRNDYGRTALLMVARETGSAEMARLLADNGADVNAADRSGATSLDLAAWRGFGGIVDVLLDAGADLPESDERRESILEEAIEKGLVRLFRKLVETGVRLDKRNSCGGSLLHSACQGGAREIVETLIDRGLNLNEQDRYGWTPLHYAAKKGRYDVAELLLQRGVDLEVRTLAGRTPLGSAEEFEKEDLITLLRDAGADSESSNFPILSGPYMGHPLPGDEPIWFAGDIVSSNRFEHGTVTFSPDGREAYWSSSYLLNDSGYTYGRILTSRLENGMWTEPHLAPFSGIQQGDDVPFFAPDGRRLYFLSSRPIESEGRSAGENIWYVDKTDEGWSGPRIIQGGPNALGLHWQFSVAANGNVYFGSSASGGFGEGDIYVSRLVDGVYQEPENLGRAVNSQFDESSPYIAPDESYLIVTTVRHPETPGFMNLCIFFKDGDGNWSSRTVMPEPINSASRELCPQVTPDGKYLFFNSWREGGPDNYWMSAGIIETLRGEALTKRHATRPVCPRLKLHKSSQEFPMCGNKEVLLGDLDGDGDLDAAACDEEHGKTILSNDGTGLFTSTEQLLADQVHGMSMGDLDGDGDLDLVLAVGEIRRGGELIDAPSKVFLNDGRGQFAATDQNLEDFFNIYLADVDGDGDLDGIGDRREPNVLYLNDGHGRFVESVEPFPELSALGDLDGDGDVDIMYRLDGSGISVSLNDGRGSFTEHWQMIDSSLTRGHVCLGDVDNDGDLDALVTNGRNIKIEPTLALYNDGSGRFERVVRDLPPTRGAQLTIGDLDGDGHPDVFAANFGIADQVWLNDGRGGLVDSGLRLGGNANNMNGALGDLDGDGDLDVFVSDFFSGPHTVWFNETR